MHTVRQYVGYASGVGFIRFSTRNYPTRKSHGSRYTYVIGPFKTKRAAEWVVKYGMNNPHFQCVGDAERLSNSV